MARKPVINKYKLYEQSVQSPDVHTELFVSLYKEHRGKYAKHLREDFCGTFQLSCAWVDRNRKNTALAIDLDPEPLGYGKKHNLSKLSKEQKSRIQIKNENVLDVSTPKSDIIIAMNFSFYFFKERALLINYFRHALRSLRQDGLLLVDMAGGPGMIAPLREQRTIKVGEGKKATYTWHQKSFDPITHDALYAIHFKLPDGAKLNDAFTYDWRLWTIPEVREAMIEAGFAKTVVYWETEHRGEGTGEYVQMKKGTNDYAWIAYVVGLK